MISTGDSKLAPTLLKAGDLDEALMILTVRILVAEALLTDEKFGFRSF